MTPLVLLAGTCLLPALGAEAGPTMLVTAENPQPKELPTLGVWQDQGMTYVRATFPNVPDFACDTWCYESAVDFLDAKPGEGGRLILRHRDKAHPEALYVTTVTPEPEAVEFLVRPEVDPARGEKLPEQLVTPNACWQLHAAPGFASKPDPYPEFVKRCFLFTERGFTYLHWTQRGRIPVRPAEDPYNNPPWVQMYGPVWRPVQVAVAPSWAAYSTDRYTYPVIGTVSRDGRWLAAIANDTGTTMAQAWHDCMHNNASWEKEPDGRLAWRIRIYAMRNDPQALLRRLGRDFPRSLKLKEVRVDPEAR